MAKYFAPMVTKNSLGTAYLKPKDLLAACIKYFDDCDATVIRKTLNAKGQVTEEYTRPYTLSGLALHLGLSRQQLVNYSHADVYGDVVLWARQKCENYIEENMLVGRLNTIGSIFNLKNNYGWKDKTEVDNTLTIDRVDTNNLKDLSSDELRKLVLTNGQRTIDLVVATPDTTARREATTSADTASTEI